MFIISMWIFNSGITRDLSLCLSLSLSVLSVFLSFNIYLSCSIQRVLTVVEDHCRLSDLDLDVRPPASAPLSSVSEFVRDTFAANLHQDTALIKSILQLWTNR